MSSYVRTETFLATSVACDMWINAVNIEFKSENIFLFTIYPSFTPTSCIQSSRFMKSSFPIEMWRVDPSDGTEFKYALLNKQGTRLEIQHTGVPIC